MRVGGIAKGSGMIHPNMATMLSVVTCDAAVEPGLWRALFKRSAVKSFNQVSGVSADRQLVMHKTYYSVLGHAILQHGGLPFGKPHAMRHHERSGV